MEETDEDTPRTPFWIQTTTNVRRLELYRRRASSLFFNSGVLILLLLLFALLCILFIIPSLISFTSHFFKPNLIKKNWESINLVLVLFALAFGFLSRNINNDQTARFDRSRSELSTGTPVNSTPHQWYEFPEQPIGGLRRHRSTSSYPDLRELSPASTAAPWRFSDDTYFNRHRSLDTDRYYFRREEDSNIKEVVLVDTVMDLPKRNSDAPPSQSPPEPPAPPSPPPQPQVTTPVPRTYHNVAVDDGERSSVLQEIVLPVTAPPLLPAKSLPAFQDSERKGRTGVTKKGKRERRRARSSEPGKMASTVNDPAPELSSPPPNLPVFQDSDQKNDGVERKRSGANATKEFFTSFYQKKKKKRQRQRSVDNLDILLHRPQPPVTFQQPPPPPPPPPPVLSNLFSFKKERRNKTSAATPPPPPPPPRTAARDPRPTETRVSTAARAPRPTVTRVSPFVTEKPRVPVKMSYFHSIDDSSSGGESPMTRIPPPPPMPPFKMPDWKFPVEGDYVRVQSTLSSGSGSPDGDEGQSPSSGVASPLFCPSPDVDTKADSFIARFRAGLKLEKINSFNQNQGLRMSKLGPGPSPSHNYGV